MSRICIEPGCPTITDQRRCPQHERANDRARGSRQARGYNANHDRERARWAPLVATGTVRCWRCHELIPAAGPFDLGHDDHDRTIYRGPEHPPCNRGARPH